MPRLEERQLMKVASARPEPRQRFGWEKDDKKSIISNINESLAETEGFEPSVPFWGTLI
jgi:hypothetical protein